MKSGCSGAMMHVARIRGIAIEGKTEMDDIQKWWYCRLHVIWAVHGQQLPLDLDEDITRLKAQGWRLIDVVKRPDADRNEEIWVLQRSSLEH